MSAPLCAAFATDPARSRGRLHPEPAAQGSAFQQDCDRILHSGGFRRLQYKTQVFVFHEGDYYRTRLTHSLEVARISRTIARALALDEDLAEAVALAHDLGHTPFGHAGEDALDCALRDYGGFDHNVQALRILTALERRFLGFDGLNLTWETLEGVVKHNGPLVGRLAGKRPPSPAVVEYASRHALPLDGFASAEAQVAALADDIAYVNHDIEDGLRAGLFDEADLADLPLVGPLLVAVRSDHPQAERPRIIHETIRRMTEAMTSDVVAESRRRVSAAEVESPDAVRAAEAPVVAFSGVMAESNGALMRFLFARMYRHFRVNRMTSKARRVVRELFDVFHAEPNTLPLEWAVLTDRPGTARTARVVGDYIAGMTDRYALDEHRRLFDPYSRT